MQQLYQQTARRAEKASTKNLWQAATNPKNGPLDESGGTYMLGYSEQSIQNQFQLLISRKNIGKNNQLDSVQRLKATPSFVVSLNHNSSHRDNFHR